MGSRDEGGSDARFFEAVMKSLFEKKYDRVVIRAYASMKRSKFSALLGAVRAMGADYLVVADNDHAPCITAKKEWVGRGVAGLQPQRIRVVVEEIESWYAAGLDREEMEKRIAKLEEDLKKKGLSAQQVYPAQMMYLPPDLS